MCQQIAIDTRISQHFGFIGGSGLRFGRAGVCHQLHCCILLRSRLVRASVYLGELRTGARIIAKQGSYLRRHDEGDCSGGSHTGYRDIPAETRFCHCPAIGGNGRQLGMLREWPGFWRQHYRLGIQQGRKTGGKASAQIHGQIIRSQYIADLMVYVPSLFAILGRQTGKHGITLWLR